jgi:hypothetical protein
MTTEQEGVSPATAGGVPAPDLARERAVYADSPDDRLYHAADNTWWRRTEDGRLVPAEPPETVTQAFAENQNLRWTLASLKGGIAAAERLLKPTEPAGLIEVVGDDD